MNKINRLFYATLKKISDKNISDQHKKKSGKKLTWMIDKIICVIISKEKKFKTKLYNKRKNNRKLFLKVTHTHKKSVISGKIIIFLKQN